MKYWKIQAFEKQDKNYQLINCAIVNVHAENEEEALDKAKNALKRNGYRVAEVFEEEQNHEFNEDLKMAQLEAMSKLLKFVK